MHQQGYKRQQIADALGLTQAAVSLIIKRAKVGGVAVLRHHKPSGPKARLRPEQQQELLAELAQGAEAHGFHGDVWTTQRVAQFIAQEFGVKHHPDHIGPLLRQLGWSPQRPIIRASQRDEAAIEEWVMTTGPELQKSGSGRAHDSLRGRIRLLSAARRSPHLGACGRDADGRTLGCQARHRCRLLRTVGKHTSKT